MTTTPGSTHKYRTCGANLDDVFEALKVMEEYNGKIESGKMIEKRAIIQTEFRPEFADYVNHLSKEYPTKKAYNVGNALDENGLIIDDKIPWKIKRDYRKVLEKTKNECIANGWISSNTCMKDVEILDQSFRMKRARGYSSVVYQSSTTGEAVSLRVDL